MTLLIIFFIGALVLLVVGSLLGEAVFGYVPQHRRERYQQAIMLYQSTVDTHHQAMLWHEREAAKMRDAGLEREAKQQDAAAHASAEQLKNSRAESHKLTRKLHKHAAIWG